jgi:hypothetical protein
MKCKFEFYVFGKHRFDLGKAKILCWQWAQAVLLLGTFENLPKNLPKMSYPGVEPGAFCVLDRCDNRYTSNSSCGQGEKFAVMYARRLGMDRRTVQIRKVFPLKFSLLQNTTTKFFCLS